MDINVIKLEGSLRAFAEVDGVQVGVSQDFGLGWQARERVELLDLLPVLALEGEVVHAVVDQLDDRRGQTRQSRETLHRRRHRNALDPRLRHQLFYLLRWGLHNRLFCQRKLSKLRPRIGYHLFVWARVDYSCTC